MKTRSPKQKKPKALKPVGRRISSQKWSRTMQGSGQGKWLRKRYTYIYIHTYICVYMCIYIYICVYIYMYDKGRQGSQEPGNGQWHMKGDKGDKERQGTRQCSPTDRDIWRETERDKGRQGAQQPGNGHQRILNRMLLSRLVQSLLPLALWFPDLIGLILWSDSWSRFLRLIRTLSDLIPAASIASIRLYDQISNHKRNLCEL